MPPNTEPSQADVAAVSAMLGGQPAPVPAPAPAPVAEPAPAQQQPAPVQSQPSPTTQPTDPFAGLFASEPPAPVEPAAAPAPQPVEPVAPVAPAEPVAPVVEPVAQVAPADDYQTYEDYMTEVLAGVPQAPVQPDPDSIDPNDPKAIKGFFDDLVNTAVQRAQSETAKSAAIQNAERTAWDNAFEKYGSLRSNKNLRDMVHNIRMGYMQRGVAMTPTQAADKLLESLGQERRAGAADSAVITTIEQVQPNGGGTGAVIETTLDKKNTLEAVQTGGETALAAMLDQEIKNGRTW